MNTWYSRPVFFVSNCERALEFYKERLGFEQKWTYVREGEVIVAQVNRGDFELILNRDEKRAGSGRIYFHLTDDQIATLREEFAAKGVATQSRQWGMPISVVLDPDGNELYFDSLDPSTTA